MRAPTSLSDLPNELLLEIFDYLDWDGLTRDPANIYKPLKNLAGVSHYFRLLLSPRLFRTLRCKYDPFDSWTNPQTVSTLLNRPYIAHNARSLVFDLYDIQRYYHPDIARHYNNFLRAVTVLSELEAITLEIGDWESPALRGGILDTLPPSLRLERVKTLHVMCHTSSLLAHCPNTTNLRIKCTSQNDLCACLLVPCSKVEYLTFEGRMSDKRLQVLASSYPNVRHLTHRWYDILDAQWYLPLVTHYGHCFSTQFSALERVCRMRLNRFALWEVSTAVVETNADGQRQEKWDTRRSWS